MLSAPKHRAKQKKLEKTMSGENICDEGRQADSQTE